MTLDEFAKDPLGEKQRLANIANLNNELKGEIYENRLSKYRAKVHAEDTGLDQKEKMVASVVGGRNTLTQNPFNTDERFKQLFK